MKIEKRSDIDGKLYSFVIDNNNTILQNQLPMTKYFIDKKFFLIFRLSPRWMEYYKFPQDVIDYVLRKRIAMRNFK